MPSGARILAAAETLTHAGCDLIASTLDMFEPLRVKGVDAWAPGRGVKVVA